MKTTRQIVEELVTAYVDQCDAIRKLQSMGADLVDFCEVDRLLSWAMDLVGFPPDTTVNEDKSENPDGFCRDGLYWSSLIDEAAQDNVHSTVSEYVDWLYTELEEYKKEGLIPVE